MPSLAAVPQPAPVDTTVRIDGAGFGDAKTRLTLDGVGKTTNIFRPSPDGTFHVGIHVAATVKAQTLVAEQYIGGRWKMVARLAPLLTFLPPSGADTTAPVITGIAASSVTTTSFIASWLTNEPATSKVEYGTTVSYGSQVTNDSLLTTHNIPVSGLSAATLYHYRVTSVDAAGNTTVSADQTFTTAAPASSLTLSVDPVATVSADGTSVQITWTWSTYATGQVLYGLTTALGQQSTKENSYTYQTHIQTIGSLTPNQIYYFRVTGADAAGNAMTSGQFSFNTAVTGGGGGGGPTTFYATFNGDGTDQTAALKAFLEANKGHDMALAGTINLASTCRPDITGSATTITWLSGAKLVCTNSGYAPILLFVDCTNITLYSPEIQGSAYFWQPVGTSNSNREEQHAIEIAGGSNIVINDPNLHDTLGDGIYYGTQWGASGAPASMVVNRPAIIRSSRNGITVNAGVVAINDGSITYSGLHNIDLEPNSAADAATISMSVEGTNLSKHSDLTVHDPGGGKLDGCAVSACGNLGGRKILISIIDCTSDNFELRMQDASTCTVTGNVSTAVVDGPGGDIGIIYDMTTYTFTGNTNMTMYTGGAAC